MPKQQFQYFDCECKQINAIFILENALDSIQQLMTFRKFCLVSLLVLGIFSQTCCDLNTIKVTGNSQVKIKPDFATIEIGAEAQQKTTSEALKSLNQKIDGLINIIKRNGIPDKDYSTSSLTLSQVYEDQNGERVLVGQKATQTLSVKVRNLDAEGSAIGFLIDTASYIDGVIINGVTFDKSDPNVGVKQARKAAYDAAKKKAEEYAALTGMRLRKPTRIEAIDGGSIVPFYTVAASFKGDFKTLVPVKDVTITADVEVSFSLLP